MDISEHPEWCICCDPPVHVSVICNYEPPIVKHQPSVYCSDIVAPTKYHQVTIRWNLKLPGYICEVDNLMTISYGFSLPPHGFNNHQENEDKYTYPIRWYQASEVCITYFIKPTRGYKKYRERVSDFGGYESNTFIKSTPNSARYRGEH